jgi:hypothetical protein
MIENAYKGPRTLRVDRRLRKSAKEYARVMGRGYVTVWVLIVLAGFVALYLIVTNTDLVSARVWAGLFALGALLAPLYAIHAFRVQRDEFKELWNDKEHILGVLTQLEGRRAEAAALQIEGNGLRSADAVPEWIARVEKWRVTTRGNLYDLHPAEAGYFSTLGLYRPVTLVSEIPFHVTTEQKRTLEHLRERMARLNEIRDRWVLTGY